MDAAFDRARPYLTLRQAAAYIGIGERTLRRARDAGELAVSRLGERTQRVAVEELRRWIASRRVAPTNHARARLAEVLNRERVGVP